MQVLNFYSTVFADQLKKGRKTATIRLGDKSHKYRKNQAVMVTIGYQHSPREKIFDAVIDQVEVMALKELSPDDTVTVVRFSQIIDKPAGMTERIKGFGGAQN